MGIAKRIEAMYILQSRLNDETNGKEWREGINKDGKRINWRRCIVMETAELIDSFPWKHWKSIDSKIDLQNIQIEVVDIWHFVMSELLRLEPLEQACERSLHCHLKSEFSLPSLWHQKDNEEIDTYLAPYERLMALALESHEDEAWKNAILSQFFLCCYGGNLHLDELYRLYIGKNALNQFRQKHGYKEGMYRKLWNGREDNQVMQAILQRWPDITYEDLMVSLEKEYSQVQ